MAGLYRAPARSMDDCVEQAHCLINQHRAIFGAKACNVLGDLETWGPHRRCSAQGADHVTLGASHKLTQGECCDDVPRRGSAWVHHREGLLRLYTMTALAMVVSVVEGHVCPRPAERGATDGHLSIRLRLSTTTPTWTAAYARCL
jgi:hypothetical protein